MSSFLITKNNNEKGDQRELWEATDTLMAFMVVKASGVCTYSPKSWSYTHYVCTNFLYDLVFSVGNLVLVEHQGKGETSHAFSRSPTTSHRQ
jgi:hypothetical protein